jgi:acyl-CoA synthetase (AMP-forming)/AMP-acid ligase II
MAVETGYDSSSGIHPALTTWVDDRVRGRYEPSGCWAKDTWVEHFLAHAEAAPESLAVIDEAGSLTQAEVLAQARRLAAYLWEAGVRDGDVVTLVLPNWSEFMVIHAAIGLLGGVVNPLLPKVGTEEMRHILGTARSRFVFASGAERSGSSPYQAARAAAEAVGSVLDVVTVRGRDDRFREILGTAWEDAVTVPHVVRDARGWDTVTFTSGTESLPKGVVHSHQSTMFGIRAYIEAVLNLTADDCVFMPSPICHASGLQWGLRTAVVLGIPLVLQDRWDPVHALRLIDGHRCTYTLAATPFVVDLIQARRGGQGDGSSLNLIACGGAPIPRHLVAAVAETFDARLMAVFGASETYVTTATRPSYPPHMLATDGAPLPGVEVAIVDEDGKSLPGGAEGEIVTRGPQVFLGYLGNPDLTRRAFRGEWYRFGDLGVIDEDGMLHVTGRIKDVVIRGGENISVRAVEELLQQHPAVQQVAVVGYPDPRLGERCCAVVVPAGGRSLDLAQLTSFLLDFGLAKYKLPERLLLVDQMPMTATGKIRKAELRALVAEESR